MLEAMVDCAYGLGLRFGQAAKAEADAARCLEHYDAFQRAFLAVRMGIRLSMRLRAALRSSAADRSPTLEAAEAERLEVEPLEALDPEPAERYRDEVEREREREPVSLTRFLATLGVVADAADRLDPDLTSAAETVPRLRALLAQAHAGSAPSEATPRASAGDVAVLTRPRAAPPKAARLGSATPPRLHSRLVRQPSAGPRPPRDPLPDG